MKNTIVYLAGGFHSDWQEKVIEAINKMQISNVEFRDPKENAKGKDLMPLTYVTWDSIAIRESEIVFVYIEKTNPAVGVLVEIGYAKGLGKKVICVIEPGHNSIKDRYFDFPRYLSDVYFSKLEDGIEYLKSILHNGE